MQTSPIPDEAQLKLYYRNFSFLQPDPSAVHDQVASIRQSLMHHIGSAGQDQSLLDYGGGFGLYTKAAIDLGWNATLFDYDTGALDFAATHLGIKRCLSDTHHVRDCSFDIIWAFHVAEHWRSITDSINELHRLLKPGGKLIVVTLNARSREKYVRPSHFYRYMRAWKQRGLSGFQLFRLLLAYDSVFCWDPPRHLYAFTPLSMRSIGDRYGFDTEIRIGSNNKPLFEPRRYIISDPALRFATLARTIVTTPWKMGASLALCSLAFEQSLFRFFDTMFPSGGEHLYAIFRKK